MSGGIVTGLSCTYWLAVFEGSLCWAVSKGNIRGHSPFCQTLLASNQDPVYFCLLPISSNLADYSLVGPSSLV